MGQYYDNLKIKNKLFIAHLLIVFTICTASLLAFQIILRIYDGLLYNEASQVLNLSTVTIENDLKRVEKLSYNVVSDSSIQEYAQKIKTSHSDFDSYTYTDYLTQRLQALAATENYITGVIFIDTEGNQTTTGTEAILMEKDEFEQVMAKTSEQKGGNIFIVPVEGGTYLLGARQLRATSNLSLEPLGTIVIRVNLNKLMERYASFLPKYEVNLMIKSGDRIVYRSDNLHEIEQSNFVFDNEVGYKIANVNGKKMFISYTTSQYTKWVYANALPFESIFQKVTFLRNVIITIFILLFFSVSIISMRIARNLTRPIEKLSARMKYVENGEFELEENDSADSLRMDEIGHLHKDFEIMIRKINTLIKENYTKQIIIKDTQIKALQAQINPHFLYNTLESINWLAKVNKQQSISRMVESLGTLLRSAISNKESVIALSEELCLLESYITIQKIRFEERLDFQMDIGDSYKGCRIPKLTLQPIVENSIQYGLENMLDVCKISVKAIQSSEGLDVTIEDNGPGIEAEVLEKLKAGEVKPRGFGIGLKNIDDRIRLIFGDQYGILVESEAGRGTKVIIRIPYEKEPQNV